MDEEAKAMHAAMSKEINRYMPDAYLDQLRVLCVTCTVVAVFFIAHCTIMWLVWQLRGRGGPLPYENIDLPGVRRAFLISVHLHMLLQAYLSAVNPNWTPRCFNDVECSCRAVAKFFYNYGNAVLVASGNAPLLATEQCALIRKTAVFCSVSAAATVALKGFIVRLFRVRVYTLLTKTTCLLLVGSFAFVVEFALREANCERTVGLVRILQYTKSADASTAWS